MKEKNMTPSQFADEIGVQRSGMSHLVSGRNKPSLEFVLKVLKRFPDVSPEYLLFGEKKAGGGADTTAGQSIQDQPEEIQPTLFDIAVDTPKPVEPGFPEKNKREVVLKEIERIVVFYDDRTFREYIPD